MYRSLRRAAPGALLLSALAASPAFAADKAATPEGAATLQGFFASVLPKPAAGADPLVTVKPDGSSYVVSLDIGAVSNVLKASGGDVSYEPARIVYRLIEQDDGKWRVVLDSFPKLVAHAEDVTSTFEIRNFNQTLTIDPAIAWWISGSGAAEGGASTTRGPDVDQSVNFGPVKGEYATTAGAAGAVSSTAKDSFSDIVFKASGQGKDQQPVNVSGRFDNVAFNIGVDGLKTRKLFDAWSLVSANRDNLAAHTDELKGLLRELAAPGSKLAEGAEGTKGMFASPMGAITLGAFKMGAGVSNAGKDSAIDLALTAEGLSLPVGLAPPGAATLTPSKIDLSATLKGLDLTAGASAAIDRFRFEDGKPKLTDDDMAQVAQAFLSAGPLRVDIAPSHIVAPALDADLQGVIRYVEGHAAGTMTIRMRNFDMTMAAIKGLGPDIERKALPGLAMAKGLAKSESDGSLSWNIEVDENRSITINGLPLGKAPG